MRELTLKLMLAVAVCGLGFTTARAEGLQKRRSKRSSYQLPFRSDLSGRSQRLD